MMTKRWGRVMVEISRSRIAERGADEACTRDVENGAVCWEVVQEDLASVEVAEVDVDMVAMSCWRLEVVIHSYMGARPVQFTSPPRKPSLPFPSRRLIYQFWRLPIG